MYIFDPFVGTKELNVDVYSHFIGIFNYSTEDIFILDTK